MSNLIFNLRIWKFHFQIGKFYKISIKANETYDFKRDPFIWLFQFGNILRPMKRKYV